MSINQISSNLPSSGTSSVGGPTFIQNPSKTNFSFSPSGDVQLGGVGISLDPVFTKANQSAVNMLAEISAAISNPSEKMSVNDIAIELTIMMIKHTIANKNVEREMRAELAQVQFQNGMKIADLIKQKGEMAYKKAVTQAITQVASAVVALGAERITEYVLTPRYTKQGVQTGDVNGKGNANPPKEKINPTEFQRQRALTYAGLVSNVAKEATNCVGTLIGAELELGMSKIDAEKQVLETMGKLIDSISSSVESSIKSHESAIQFAMSMLTQLMSLEAEACNKIIGNMR